MNVHDADVPSNDDEFGASLPNAIPATATPNVIAIGRAEPADSDASAGQAPAQPPLIEQPTPDEATQAAEIAQPALEALLAASEEIDPPPAVPVPGALLTDAQLAQLEPMLQRLLAAGKTVSGDVAEVSDPAAQSRPKPASPPAPQAAPRAQAVAPASGSGVQDLVSGLSNLGGAVGSILGLGATVLGNSLRPGGVRGVALMPKLSDYRVAQLEKFTGEYAGAVSRFWDQPAPMKMRARLEEMSRRTGASVPDLVAELRGNGTLAVEAREFRQSLLGDDGALAQRRAMDKAMHSWRRQRDKAATEQLSLSPDEESAKLKARVAAADEQMLKAAGLVPAFNDQEPSHLESLREFLAGLVERLKEWLSRWRGTPEESGNGEGPSF